jgi:hypothetical protein
MSGMRFSRHKACVWLAWQLSSLPSVVCCLTLSTHRDLIADHAKRADNHSALLADLREVRCRGSKQRRLLAMPEAQ